VTGGSDGLDLPLLVVIIPICIGVGAFSGLFNGFFVAKIRIPSFAVTIATMMIFRNLGVAILNKRTTVVPISHFGSFEYMLIGFLVTFAIAYYLFDYRSIGKFSKAMGANESASEASGVPILGAKIWAFVLSGLSVGIAAPFHIARLGLASPKAGSFFEFDVITAVVIGGTPLTGGSSSRVHSVVIGGLLVGILSNGMTLLGIDPVIKDLMKGVILIVAVALSLERAKLVTIK
jgi:ribose/xylose/arabinose/galactoside ABC-type transport system permease subunit